MIRASGGLSCQDIGDATQHSAPLEPASLFRSSATNIRIRWSRPRYFAHTLQTFGSAGAGLVISLTRYKHSAPLEPASLFRSHATNIWLRWSRPRYFAHTLQTFGSAGAGLVISLTSYKH